MAIKFLSDINADGSNTDINADGAIKISDTTILETNATYTMLSNPEGSRCLYLGDGGDRHNYYDNNTHRFRNAGGGTEYMRINSTGVGVGTNNPSSNLHVHSAGGSGVVTQIKVSQADDGAGHPGADAILQSSGWGEAYLKLGSHKASAYGGDFNIESATDLALKSGGNNTRLFINSSGNVGIGTTSPTQKLDVNGDVKASNLRSDNIIGGSSLVLSTSGGANIELYGAGNAYYDAVSHVFRSANASSTAMQINTSTGNVGIGTTAPLRNLHVKKNNSGGQVRMEVFNTSNTANSHGVISIYSGGASGGDPFLHWKIDAQQDWSMGIDNSDSDKLKISKNFGPGINDYLTVDTSGNVGIGTTSPSSKLHVAGAIKTTGDVTMSSNTTLHIGNVDLTTGSGGNTVSVECATSSATAMNFKTSGGTVGAYMMYQGTTTTRFAGRVEPSGNRTLDLGTDALRWRVVYCETLDSAGQHESNLQDREQPVGQYITGTVLAWKNGKNRPCTQFADHMRMGIAVLGQDSPLVQGAEPVLCTGIVEEGDYLVTSEKEGHAVAIPRHIVKEQLLFDCVIGKALQDGEGESHLIKTWINI